MKITKTIKIIGYIIVIFVMCFGLFFFLKNITPKKIPSNKTVLQSIKFETDGHITKKFLIKALAIRKDILFSEINIFKLKEKLLNISQIKDVYIERQFPASIFIKIKERIPLLKFVIQTRDKIELLFIDKFDGSIFRGSCLPKSVILTIPYVDLNLERSKQTKMGYQNVRGITKINQFINLLEKEYPDIYKDVNKISLLNYDPREEALWSRIEIHKKNGQIISFSPQNLNIQLLNLDYMLNEYGLRYKKMKKIDLSSVDSAIIEIQ